MSWSFFKKRPKTRQGNCLVFPQASCSPDGLSQDSDHKKALPWLPETGLSSAHSKKISQHTIPSYKTKSIILSLEVHHIHWEYFLISSTRTHLVSMWYNCQRFLTYKHDIFILGVLGFLKTTRSFPKIPEEVRSLPKTSKVLRRRPKSAEGELAPSAFHFKNQDREEHIVIYSFYTWFSFLTWVWVNIFLEIVSSKTATTRIFQSGVRNWPASVSRREIEVFNPHAWELASIMWSGDSDQPYSTTDTTEL